MPDYPGFPLPSSISAPEIIDEIYQFRSDFGYQVRRSRSIRPRRRYTISYLGKTTHELRLMRHFFNYQRYGVLPFSFWHLTGVEPITFSATTPIQVSFSQPHGLFDNQWLAIFASPAGNAANGFWQLTIPGPLTALLKGSTSVGSGVGTAAVYLPKATGIFNEDTMASAARVNYGGGEGSGVSVQRWSFQVVIEEQF